MTNSKKSNEHYDIVIANGRVIDPETYLDAQMYTINLIIKDGKIYKNEL